VTGTSPGVATAHCHEWAAPAILPGELFSLLEF